MWDRMSRWIFCIITTILIFIVGGQVVQADYPTPTLDYAPTQAPNFDDYTEIEVNSLSDLTNSSNGLPSSKDKVIYVLQKDITMTGQIKIVKNKAIDLNGHTLDGGENIGSLLIEQSNKTTENFALYNGTITGGPTSKGLGGDGGEVKTNTAFLNVPVALKTEKADTVRNILIEDVTYNSSKSGGSFVVALASNVFFKGTVNVSTYCTNVRAGNMTFFGEFNGDAFGIGDQDQYSQGSGGLNLSFGGRDYAYIGDNNYGTKTLNTSVGDRRIYITENAKVTLNNENSSTSTFKLTYTNNIANFSSLLVKGSLICKSIGTSLNSSASYRGGNGSYSYTNSSAGTFNGMVNIVINDKAIFEITSQSTEGVFGALSSPNTNIYANQPQSFDMRYMGNGNFFYSQNSRSNMYINGPMNIGVWDKEQKGIGNPSNSWSDVDWMSVVGFMNLSSGTVTSSNTDLKNVFNIAKYSRISNDVGVPVIIAAPTIDNGATSFSGSTDYQEKDGNTLPGYKLAGATVTLTIDGKGYTTTTDSQGEWTFNDLNLSTLAGGTKGTLNLTDADLRTANPVTVTVKDTIPPSVTTQVIKVKINTANGLDDPKAGIKSASDETTATSKLSYSYKTSQEDRNNMLKEVGVYTVEVDVSDESGNTTTASVPVIVYDGSTPTNSFVVGNNFAIDYHTWENASDDEKRNIVMSEGAVKGYRVTDTDVTEVSDDMLSISIPNEAWEGNKTYNISTSVGDYTKIIQVTLIPSTVKMTIQQIYEGTEKPIYSDLESKTSVDNTKTSEVDIGSNIEYIVNELIDNKQLALNYTGYDIKNVGDYKIYQNGTEVLPTPMTAPNSDFTLVYEYNGQLIFGNEVATNLTFGSIELTDRRSDTPLTDMSDQKISIINTSQNNNWTLKAAVPDDITRDDNKIFLGSLVYKNSDSNEFVIGTSATIIERQSDDSLYCQLNLKDDTNGLFIQQSSGNLKGNYSGKVVWTLEDTP